jgi:UPF0716 protein FxsA
MPLVLVIAFIVVPLVELAIILQVGELIGAAWTIVALLVVSIAGAWLVRREGTRAWARLVGALRDGRMPTDEVLAGALVLVGGALLLTPGFATDTVGLLLVIPPSRTLVASAVKTQVGRRVAIRTFGTEGLFGSRGGSDSGRRPGGQGGRAGGDVVDVEVVDVRRDRPVDGRSDGDRPDDDVPNRDRGSG